MTRHQLFFFHLFYLFIFLLKETIFGPAENFRALVPYIVLFTAFCMCKLFMFSKWKQIQYDSCVTHVLHCPTKTL